MKARHGGRDEQRRRSSLRSRVAEEVWNPMVSNSEMFETVKNMIPWPQTVSTNHKGRDVDPVPA